MHTNTDIKVTSHVSRDFLQNSAYFNTLSKVVWEYVANSLDAVAKGTRAVIIVDITSNYITVSDNGQGMSREDLSTFFQMHGENIHRKEGKRVRGRFGTGKSAAFGIADTLQIETIKDGYKNIVELNREDIEQAKSGEPFKVHSLVKNGITESENGAVVTIKNLNLKRPQVDKVITYIEKQLGRYKKRSYVTINGHECIFKEPHFIEEYKINPPKDVSKEIGEVILHVKISPTPLNEDINGIDILSHGIYHETTLAGIESKERAKYLFGEIDVPILEDGEWKVPAFDNTRNNELNRQNFTVIVLLGWLSEELEKIRSILVAKEKERKRSEKLKQLEEDAEKIADILNQDFALQEIDFEIQKRIAKKGGSMNIDEILDRKGELWPGDGDLPTPWQQTGSPHGSGKKGDVGGEGDEPRPGPNVIPGNDTGDKKESKKGKQKKRKGVFSIEYVNETSNAKRSRYDSELKTIFINLDHPQISNAFESGGSKTDSRSFRNICYEIAIVEYSIALPFEKLERFDIYLAEDALYDVSDTIDRVTKRFMAIMS